MRLRVLPRTPQWALETPNREVPDEYRIRSYGTLWQDTRYIVEARRKGRVLGDRSFPDYATAREHADMNAKWDGACVTDFSKLIEAQAPPPLPQTRGDSDHDAPLTPERRGPETSATPVHGTSPLNRCERCGASFVDHRTRVMRSMARKRYCSEDCRKAAENQRAYERRKERGE